MSLRRILIAPAVLPLALLGLAAGAAPAGAAPTGEHTYQVDLGCSDGNDYSVVLVGGADDGAAGHLVGGGPVVPTAFQYQVTVLDSSGAVVDGFTTPVQPVHGRSGDRLETLTCTFSQTETQEVPGEGVFTIVLEGTVWAFLPH